MKTVYWLALVDSVAEQAEVVSGTVTDQTAERLGNYTERIHEEYEYRNFDEGSYGLDKDGPTSGLDWEWVTVDSFAHRGLHANADAHGDRQRRLLRLAGCSSRVRIARTSSSP